MTTGYGDRPGMSEQRAEHTPLTMSAATEVRERALAEKSQQPMGVIAVHFIRELDATRRLNAQAPALMAACEALVKSVDDLDAENGDRNLFVSPGCVLCTDGVTPDKHNTGLCAYHAAVAAIAAARGAK